MHEGHLKLLPYSEKKCDSKSHPISALMSLTAELKLPFFIHCYASYEKKEIFKLGYESFQVYAMMNYHTNIL